MISLKVCVFLGWTFLSIIVNKTQQSGVRWDNQESMCVSYKHTFVFKEKFEGQVANVEGTKGVTLYVLPLPPGEQSIKKTYLSLLVLNYSSLYFGIVFNKALCKEWDS